MDAAGRDLSGGFGKGVFFQLVFWSDHPFRSYSSEKSLWFFSMSY